MLVLVILISFQGKTIGHDYLIRSTEISSLKAKRNDLRQDNRDLRKQKEFVKTDQGKEIIARRHYLYKLPQETYSIVTFETQK